ncbi:MAG: hypothetical protein U9N02_06055, partial [Campylobacterota bacterium]|nr:hypothetical protein [Campylobacterota bacterium]
MDVLINELSLDGQFLDKDNFLDNLEEVLISIKLLNSLEITLLKNYTFFDSNITREYNFSELTKSKDSRIRRLKSYLLKLSNNPPFWNETQIHSCINDKYIYNSKNICNTSLAESSQRDKFILSFNHNNYLGEKIKIQKNDDNLELYNIMENDKFLDYLLIKEIITPLEFCVNRYKKSNLDFSKIEEGYGFDILNKN